MKPSSVRGALRKRVRFMKDLAVVQKYLNGEYEKAIAEILKNSNRWMSLYSIWGKLLEQGLVLRDEYERALNDVSEALNNLVKKGRCRISGDYERWHSNECGQKDG